MRTTLPQGKSRRLPSWLPWLLYFVIVVGCAAAPPAVPDLSFPVPLGSTYDMKTARTASADQLLSRLDSVRLLFLGEHHTNRPSHRFQLDTIRGLIERGRTVAVGLEMLPPSADRALEDWRRGELSEEEFLRRADWYRHWRFPWRYYRELFLYFREQGIAVHGLNASPETRKAVRGGTTGQLAPSLMEEIGDLQAPLPHERYLLWTLNRTGHGGQLRVDNPQFKRYRRVQALWDRLIGLRATKLARKQGSDGVVVVLVGSGHLAFQLGANLQAARVSNLTQVSIWDHIADEPELLEGRRYAVPLGMSDYVRVYPADATVQPIPSLTAIELENHADGVLVRKIGEYADAQAELLSAGLLAGDVVVALHRTPIKSVVALRLAYEGLARGERIELTVLRDGQTIALPLTLPETTPRH